MSCWCGKTEQTFHSFICSSIHSFKRVMQSKQQQAFNKYNTASMFLFDASVFLLVCKVMSCFFLWNHSVGAFIPSFPCPTRHHFNSSLCMPPPSPLTPTSSSPPRYTGTVHFCPSPCPPSRFNFSYVFAFDAGRCNASFLGTDIIYFPLFWKL